MTFTFKPNTIIRLVGEWSNKEPFSTTFPTSDDKIKDLTTRAKVDDYLLLGQMPIRIEGQIENQPYISATSVKARLRHGCADHVIQSCSAAGQALSLFDVYSLKVGQVGDAKSNEEKKAEGEESIIDLKREREYREAHPLQSTFGLFELSGCVDVSHGISDEKIEMAYMGGVRHELEPQFVLDNLSEAGKEQYEARRATNTDKSLLSNELKDLEKQFKAEYKKSMDAKIPYVEEEHQAKGLSYGVDKKTQAKYLLSEEGSRLSTQIAEKKAQIKALKDGQGGLGISTQMPIPVRHVVPAGHVFKQSITIKKLDSTIPSSMVIFGLECLSRYPKMGAYKGSCGLFDIKYDVLAYEDGVEKNLGTIYVGGFKKIDTQGLTPEGQSWWDQAVADTSWYNKG